jgi:magnesium transporter
MLPSHEQDLILSYARLTPAERETASDLVQSWYDFLEHHPVDIAQFLGHVDGSSACRIMDLIPDALLSRVFLELSTKLKLRYLEHMPEHDRAELLRTLSIDDLTDFFDDLSEDDLRNYLKLLHKKDRETIILKLKFAPESAGSIMHTNVITLMEDFTVERSIYILQKLQPNRSLHERIFVTNQTGQLVGYILLADLVLKNPKTRISVLLCEVELAILQDEERSEIAARMQHYRLTIAPVVDHDGLFLGIISSDTLVEIIQQEASQDMYRISAVSPIKQTYFETSFVRLLGQRGSILVVLLILQSVSSIILAVYEHTLDGFLEFFVTMLISTGGNASSQTSALAIQGLATGEIDDASRLQFVWREIRMGVALGFVLSAVSFARTYLVYANFWGSLTVSMALWLIVCFSMILGSMMPILLKQAKVDPAHAAGPILTTLIDVMGLFIYCLIASAIFR